MEEKYRGIDNENLRNFRQNAQVSYVICSWSLLQKSNLWLTHNPANYLATIMDLAKNVTLNSDTCKLSQTEFNYNIEMARVSCCKVVKWIQIFSLQKNNGTLLVPLVSSFCTSSTFPLNINWCNIVDFWPVNSPCKENPSSGNYGK